ncbi:heterokaryon incompatibility protein-domain-containing protein [Nemania sp. FL0031]|nr:heterokaryon incompatibility protein-domain-containing protein [Nemania sp. FL0031]
MEGSCAACMKLWRFLVNAGESGFIKLSDFSDKMSCSHHIPLTQLFPPKWQNKSASDCIAKFDNQAAANLAVSPDYYWGLQLCEKSSVRNHPGRDHIYNPDWVDNDIIWKWKTICLELHGERCNNPMGIWPVRPAWLIDVVRKCLVSGYKSEGRFVTLSYTYGAHTSSPLKINDKAALSQLQKPNSLSMPEIWSSISPMIKHAIYLTRVLDERFLWADALCVPHFDKANAAKELNLMGAIYANATVTIIVTSTNSGEGIPGLKDISSPRQLQQHIIPFGTEKIVARRVNYGSSKPYNYRAWTYQEYMMSPRKLIFDKDGLFWECLCNYKREWPNATSPYFPQDGYRIDPTIARFPDPESMHKILTNFNSRDLTYDMDALPSITGLLSIFSRSFKGGFFALGWRIGPVPKGRRPFRRRRPSPDTSGLDRVDLGPSGLPSWSWIGWQGVFSTDHCDNARLYAYREQVRENFPITEWFTAKSPTVIASKRRRIQSTWARDREIYKDSSAPLPIGWTRHKVPYMLSKSWTLYPEGCGSFAFRHEGMKQELESRGRSLDWWYYPVPVADFTASTMPFMPEQTEYLFCTTYKASLQTTKANNDYPNVVNVLNTREERVGFLEPTNGLEDLLSTMPKQVELVAISRFKEYKREDRDDPTEITEHIAVLWVEWEGRVAYRRGYGEVEKEKWDELPLECIELVLG